MGKPALPADELKTLWRARRASNAPLDQSGVWRYREFVPFLSDYQGVVTLREGNTPLLEAPQARSLWRARQAGVQAPGLSTPPGLSKTTG